MKADRPLLSEIPAGAATGSLADQPGALDFLCLRLTCRALRAFQLDNPASDLHGGFGLMLHAHAPMVYAELMGAQTGSGDVRPYVLRALPSLSQRVANEASFGFELLLFGKAVRHALQCLELLSRLGQQGLTAQRHRYRIEAIERISPEGATLMWAPASAWQADGLQPVAAAALLARPAAGTRLRLEWLTPVRLKQGDQILRTCPEPALLMQRLLGRASLLASQQGDLASVPARAGRRVLEEVAAKLCLSEVNMHWVSAPRYSVRQKQGMDMGGLVGSLVLEGDFGALAGWLALGQWLHVGGKASFGQGQYRLQWLAGSH